MAKAVINLQKESGGIVKISPADGTGVTELVVPESGNLVSVGTAVTDNAIARYDGTTGKLQDSGVIINDNGNVIYGSYGSLLTGFNNSTQLGFNIKEHNIPTDTYSPKYFGSSAAGMSIIRMVSGGQGGLDILTKRSGTNSSEHSTNTFNKFSFTDTGSFTINTPNGTLGYGAGAGGTVTQLTSKSTTVTLNKPTGTIVMHNATLAAGATVYFVLLNSLIAGTDVVIVDWNNGYYRVTPYGSATSSCTFIVQNVSSGSLSDALEINFAIIKGSNA